MPGPALPAGRILEVYFFLSKYNGIKKASSKKKACLICSTYVQIAGQIDQPRSWPPRGQAKKHDRISKSLSIPTIRQLVFFWCTLMQDIEEQVPIRLQACHPRGAGGTPRFWQIS